AISRRARFWTELRETPDCSRYAAPWRRTMSATSNMKTPASEVFHEFIERTGQRVPNLACEVCVDRRGFRTAMTENVLNQTEMNRRFHQVCRKRVAPMSITS